LLVGLASGLASGQAAHGAEPPIALECRVGAGSWQSCQMEVSDPGRRWALVLGRRRYAFEHDGTGKMRMTVDGRQREVTPRWDSHGSLCWDGVCARGDIPLD
jgi:hypothetical protein